MGQRDYWGSGGGGRFGGGGGRFGGGGYSYSMGGGLLTPAVKWLLIVNVAIFIVYFFAARTGYGSYFIPFALTPEWVTSGFAIWQLFTYLFIHSPGDFMHILLNMLALWMFGKDLESLWGTRKFLRYYFLCGIGAGIFVVVLNALIGDMHARTIGASGAIYGLLLAFGILFPEAQLLFFMLFPIKAKYFVMIVGAMSFMMTFGDTGGGVSHMAHLGGMIWGYLYLKSRAFQGQITGADPIGWVTREYRRIKQERARRKFQVYMRKQQGGDRDRFVH